MSKRAHFRVFGRLDMASRVVAGTVTIDRALGTFEVRPLRKRRTYVLPLDMVATMVVRTIIMAELAEKRRARKTKKVKRRGV